MATRSLFLCIFCFFFLYSIIFSLDCFDILISRKIVENDKGQYNIVWNFCNGLFESMSENRLRLVNKKCFLICILDSLSKFFDLFVCF